MATDLTRCNVRRLEKAVTELRLAEPQLREQLLAQATSPAALDAVIVAARAVAGREGERLDRQDQPNQSGRSRS